MIEAGNPAGPQAETLQDEEFFRLLNAAGNHEAKLLTLGVIATHDQWFSQKMIRTEMDSRQGPEPAWPQSISNAFNYCVNSLEPIGAVVKGVTAGRIGQVDAYRATGFGRDYGLPIAGLFLQWSLDNADISLQQIFGTTSTTGAVRAPQLRYKVYESILTSPHAHTSVTDIYRDIEDAGLHERTLYQAIETLDGQGIVDARSKIRTHNPKIRINDPNYRGLKHEFSELTPATQALYRSLQAFYAQGLTEIQLQDLCDHSIATNPTADPAEIRYVANHTALNTDRHFPGVENIDEELIDFKKLTDIKLSEKFKKPISDLIAQVGSIDEDRQLYARTAEDIVRDPSKFRSLMAKARRFSNSAHSHEDGWREALQNEVVRVVSAIGEVTVSEVCGLMENNDKPLVARTVRNTLDALVEQGVLKVEKKQLKPGLVKLTQVYSLEQEG